MSRDLAKQTKSAADVRCKPCKDGKHYPDCEERACACWCIQRSVEVPKERRIGKPHLSWPDTYKDPGYLIQIMKDHKIVVRFGMDGKVYYKPSPKKLEESVRPLLTEYRREIYRLWLPVPANWSPNRPYWTLGGIQACVVCGRGTAQHNPYGEAQHPTCGFLTQRYWVPTGGQSDN